jgi:FtsP/CotA-like multicopper oxidase with cupredoxin domain
MTAAGPARTLMRMVQHLAFMAAAGILIWFSPAPAPLPHAAAVDTKPRVSVNDNRQPAGLRRGNALALKLRAAVGLWSPEGDRGPALEVEAFGEGGGPLQVPAPLIRVPQGTDIVATIRNDLTHTLRVHGLCARDGSPCAPLDVEPSSERDVRCASGRPGTYHYWATTTGMPLPFRAVADTQLSGAFIVDPASPTPPADRVLVITDWTNLTREQLHQLGKADDATALFFSFNPRFTFLVNGLSWPATERLHYRVGEDVRWRVINLSSQIHPMHLHGF